MSENNVARNSIEYLQRQHDECQGEMVKRLDCVEGKMGKIYAMFVSILSGIVLILAQMVFKFIP